MDHSQSLKNAVTPSAPPIDFCEEISPTVIENYFKSQSENHSTYEGQLSSFQNGHGNSCKESSMKQIFKLDEFSNHKHCTRISLSDSAILNRRMTPPPDAKDAEPEPSAPPLELMDKVPGYESASFEAITIPPPLPLIPGNKVESETNRCPLPSIPHLTEKEAREALLKEVSIHCCYGTKCAKDMAIVNIKHSIAFHYSLETFTEKRTTCWAFEPYTGGVLDKRGEAPFPWDIPLSPPSQFANHTTQLEVPHTASLKTCHACGGIGQKRCLNCSGKGSEYCFHCHGLGYSPVALKTENKDCLHCTGTGTRKCWKCNGIGMAVCLVCSGIGQIKCFIRLIIKWMNHVDDYVAEKVSSLSDDKIRSVCGEVICQEEDSSVLPLSHFPDTTVCLASAQLLQKHATSMTDEKVLRQRHKVSIVPVNAVSYQWKSHDGMFHVYGFEQRVFAPDYPQTCFCCSIL